MKAEYIITIDGEPDIMGNYSIKKKKDLIRCKDCKHYQFTDNRAFGMPVKMCEWFGFEDVDDDDFCSRAERRTDETDYRKE